MWQNIIVQNIASSPETVFLNQLLSKQSLMMVFLEKPLSKAWGPTNSTDFFFFSLDSYIQNQISNLFGEGKKMFQNILIPGFFIVAFEGAKDELECYLAICEVSTSLQSSIEILEKYFFFTRFSCQFKFSYLPFYVLMLETT